MFLYQKTTLNAFGETIRWIGNRTEYEHALWLKCETLEHLQSVLDFHRENLDNEFALATGADNGWPKSMPLEVRLALFVSSSFGWTPKLHAQRTIAMYVHQVMNAIRDIEVLELTTQE